MIFEARGESRFSPRRKEQIALTALVAILIAVNVTWIRQDQSRMMKDDCYWYLAELLRFTDGLSLTTPAELWSSLDRLSVAGRPPLYQLLTVPFVAVFGRSEDAALYVNAVFLIILAVSTYQIGRLAGNGSAGLLSAFLALSFPPVVHLSRTYLPHGALPACVALSTWLLLALIKERSVKRAWAFGASLAFGLLIHPNFVWFMAIPAAVFGVYILCFQTRPRAPARLAEAPAWILDKLREPFAVRGLLPGALIALGLTLPWYLTKGQELLGIMQNLAQVEEGVLKAGFSEVESNVWFWIRTTPAAISRGLALFAVVGLASATARWREPTSVLVVTLAAALAVHSLRPIPRMWWYFAGALPIAASLIAVWIASLRRGWLSRSLIAVCVTLGVFNFSVVTWGISGWSRPLALAMGSPLSTGTCQSSLATVLCPWPPEIDRWPVRDVQRLMLDDPECRRDRPCRVLIAGGFWPTRFQYHLVQDRADDRLQATFQPSRRTRPYDFDSLLRSEYLLYPDTQVPRRTSMPYETASVQFLQSPPAAFAAAHRTVAVFDTPNGGSRLLKRVAPLTVEEAEASIRALELADGDKSQGALTLSELDPSEGRLGEIRALHDRTADARSRASMRRVLIDGYEGLGRFEEVVPLLNEALELNPADLSARVRLAEAYRKIGRVDVAITELETAISLAPEKAWPRRALADAYRALGQLDRAIQIYREALAIQPDYLTARVHLATAFRELGNVDAAISELETAMAMAPENSWPFRTLAVTYLSAGKEAEAIEMYQRALRVDPQDDASRKALDRLQRPSGER